MCKPQFLPISRTDWVIIDVFFHYYFKIYIFAQFIFISSIFVYTRTLRWQECMKFEFDDGNFTFNSLYILWSFSGKRIHFTILSKTFFVKFDSTIFFITKLKLHQRVIKLKLCVYFDEVIIVLFFSKCYSIFTIYMFQKSL